MSSFDKHNPLINRYAQKSWRNMVRMIMMAVLSIQQPWHSVGTQMYDYRDKGSGSRFVWGNKRKALLWLTVNGEQLYYEALECLEFSGKKIALASKKSFLVMGLTPRVGCTGKVFSICSSATTNLLCACRKKMIPNTGKLYSVAVSLLLALRSSAAFHNLPSKALSCSPVICMLVIALGMILQIIFFTPPNK